MNTMTHAWASQQPLALQIGADLTERLRAVLAGLRQAFRSAPRGGAELRGMSDLDLRDLGIGRSEVARLLDAGR